MNLGNLRTLYNQVIQTKKKHTQALYDFGIGLYLYIKSAQDKDDMSTWALCVAIGEELESSPNTLLHYTQLGNMLYHKMLDRKTVKVSVARKIATIPQEYVTTKICALANKGCSLSELLDQLMEDGYKPRTYTHAWMHDEKKAITRFRQQLVRIKSQLKTFSKIHHGTTKRYALYLYDLEEEMPVIEV